MLNYLKFLDKEAKDFRLIGEDIINMRKLDNIISCNRLFLKELRLEKWYDRFLSRIERILK